MGHGSSGAPTWCGWPQSERGTRRSNAMGCVYNRGSKAKPNWYISWREFKENKFQPIGEDKALAEAVLKQIEGNLEAERMKRVGRSLGVKTQPPLPVPTFDSAADTFIERRSKLDLDGKPMRRSWKDDRARLDKYLRPRLG